MGLYGYCWLLQFFSSALNIFSCLLEMTVENDWLSVGLDIWTDGKQNTYQTRTCHTHATVLSPVDSVISKWRSVQMSEYILPLFIGNLVFPKNLHYSRRKTGLFWAEQCCIFDIIWKVFTSQRGLRNVFAMLAACILVGPPLWPTLKYLSNYWMNSNEILGKHSWSPEGEFYWLSLFVGIADVSMC